MRVRVFVHAALPPLPHRLTLHAVSRLVSKFLQRVSAGALADLPQVLFCCSLFAVSEGCCSLHTSHPCMTRYRDTSQRSSPQYKRAWLWPPCLLTVRVLTCEVWQAHAGESSVAASARLCLPPSHPRHAQAGRETHLWEEPARQETTCQH